MPVEAETIEKSANGDQFAFAELVREHQAMVFSLAYRVLQNRELAEDVAQEIFLQLYQNLSAIQSPSHLVFYLRKVAMHRCIDQTRRRRHRPQISLDDAPEPAAVASSSDPMLAEILRKLVAALPEVPRMIVTLRYQEDLGPAEIAEVMELPVNTVKSHLRRSLALLREKIERQLGEAVI